MKTKPKTLTLVACHEDRPVPIPGARRGVDADTGRRIGYLYSDAPQVLPDNAFWRKRCRMKDAKPATVKKSKATVTRATTTETKD